MVRFARPPKRSFCFLVPSDDGHYLLLDLERDLVLTLNAVGGEVWKMLSEGRLESEIISAVAQKYQVDERRVESDVRQMLAKVTELQLAPAPGARSTNRPPTDAIGDNPSSYPWYGIERANRPKPPLTALLAAIVGLATFDLILWVFSLKFLCCLVERWPLRKRNRTEPVMCGELCSAVEEASVWYPKKAMCLQRSAVATCLLRSHGISAQMVIGVRSVPFLAHAWIEVNGAVLNDWPGVRALYQATAAY